MLRFPVFSFPATLRDVFEDSALIELVKLTASLSPKFLYEFPVEPTAEATYTLTTPIDVQLRITEFMQVGIILDRYGYDQLLATKADITQLLDNAFFIVNKYYLFMIEHHSFAWRSHPQVVEFFEKHGNPKHFNWAEIALVDAVAEDVKYVFDPEEFTGLLLCNDDQTFAYKVVG